MKGSLEHVKIDVDRATRVQQDVAGSPDKNSSRGTNKVDSVTEPNAMDAVQRANSSSEQLFKTITDTVACLIWMSGLDKQCYFFNKAWLDFTGRTLAEESGYGWAAGVHPEDLDRCVEIYTRSFDAQQDFYMEYRLRRHDGKYCWISDKGVPHRDFDGQFLGYVGACMDIDDQKNWAVELEQKVRERTQQLSESALQLEKFNAKLHTKNKELELRILSEFSESFASYKTGQAFFNSLTQELAQKASLDYVLLGELVPIGEETYEVKCLSASVFGKPPSDAQSPFDRFPLVQVFQNEGDSQPKQCRFLWEGHSTPENFNVKGYVGYLLYDQRSRPIGLVAVIHQQEIQEMAYLESLLKIAAKRAELELLRIRNEMKLAARNAELKRQNAELDSFNYVASHDLQEPLRKIHIFAGRIIESEREHFSATAKEYFTRITASATRMQELIDDLLAYSRANTSDINFEQRALDKIIEDVRSDLSITAQRKNPVIEYANLPQIKVLPTQFHQLVLNLIENAVKYSRQDVRPHIKIHASLVESKDVEDAEEPIHATTCWKISLEDNGIGFDPKFARKIFELFQRLHNKSQYDGTGIGLAICKKIVRNHHGHIAAEGNPGKGSAFHIYIPSDL